MSLFISVLLRLFVIIITRFIVAQECYDDGVEFCINPDDILSADLFPDSFLTLEKSSNETVGLNGKRILSNGTIDEAFNAMGFHRKKMNEFLCHGFLAEKILTEVGGARVKRRLDNDIEDPPLLDYADDGNVSIHEKLLADEGSSKYKDWLQKSTTLDDVYRHYAPRSKGPKIRKKDPADKRYDDEGEGYDGAVTGYAMPAGKVGSYFNPSGGSGHNFHHVDYVDHQSDFYPQIHEEHIVIPNHEEHYHRPSYQYHGHHGKGKGHELSLRDFFEITLTALAFLAFGLFIAQLMMNVTNSATATAATAAFLQADIDATRFRRRRRSLNSSPKFGYSGNEELNELSHRVLRSLEAGFAAESDGGNCLRRVLCDYNKISKESSGGQRIWMPVWSLGMSWLSGRILPKTSSSAILSSLKAVVLGIGGADCQVLFPNCDLKEEVTRRRRRRRRRRRK